MRVIGGGFVEDSMLQGDQQLIVATPESTGEGKVAGLHDDPFPDHVPELLLRDPVFLLVVADNQRGLFDFHKADSDTAKRGGQPPSSLIEQGAGSAKGHPLRSLAIHWLSD